MSKQGLGQAPAKETEQKLEDENEQSREQGRENKSAGLHAAFVKGENSSKARIPEGGVHAGILLRVSFQNNPEGQVE